MSSTVPSKSFDRIWSPSRNGCRHRMRIPAKKFWRMSLNAKPIATDVMPRPAMRSRAGRPG
jgi:hypothetical protein